ncbi:maleylpyruvate isomerase N-terminal domain-containing protein [Streptomyces roseifaciens]|uniref:maleylpyruvate isomerase N-terminal domain-containing protein n=1 Tax=Streptomyces roseifaciens TaxID=1488406 RepID=UPI000717F420|nr:maleylpyruvate isomerase N-terminal domain-containing protein [Streptomyces roseifaciens]
MSPLSFDRFCAEVLAQTGLLRSCVKGADTRAPVPSCPGWNLGRLLRHVGGTHRRVEEAVRTRVTESAPGPLRDGVSGCTDENGEVLDAWLADGAARLVRTLREAGPCAEVRTAAGSQSAAFWVRRTVHETAIHRADAALAARAGFDLDEELALDALDEWMTFASLPEAVDAAPGRPSLLGPGRTLHFHATGPAPDATAGEWLVDLTGDTARWRHAHARAAVAVRGPLTDLLLFVHRRPTPSGSGGIEILGDEPLLDLWLERSGSRLR